MPTAGRELCDGGTTARPGWHTGSLDAGTGGVRDGYKPELGSVAQAQYSTEVEAQAAAASQGRLARFRRALRRIFWEF